MERYNANRCAIELKAARRVGQLVFARRDNAAQNPCRGNYRGRGEPPVPVCFRLRN